MSVSEPINLRDLIEGGATFNVNIDLADEGDEENHTDTEYDIHDELLKHSNYDCVGVGADPVDEDTYNEGEPFEMIAAQMEDLIKDGIKKRVLRKGYGEKPKDLSIVRVHYNAYQEYEAEPFDSTYARKRAHQFCINNGDVVPGLDLAVLSMQLGEKAQFLIQPNYAYGQLGCLNRIAPNAVVLFEVELLELVDSGAAISFNNLPQEKQKDFDEVYKYCMALCARGKDLFGKNIENAIKEYNTAVGKLEVAQLRDYEDQQKQEELLQRLYLNLLVCYTKIGKPKKGCINFNKLKSLTQDSKYKIPAKGYYNSAKCLRMLGEYDLAMKRLKQAAYLQPKNPEIASEIFSLQHEKKEYEKMQNAMGKVMIKDIIKDEKKGQE